MRWMALAAVLLSGLCLATPAASDPVDVQGLILRLQAEVRDHVAALRAGRDAAIAALTARGAQAGEATAAIDEQIAMGEKAVDAGAMMDFNERTPKLVALQARIAVINAVSNLRHARFQKFVKKLGLKPSVGFYGCLCASGFLMGVPGGYHPEHDYQDCHNDQPCKGGNWGCVTFDLPNDPTLWSNCVAAEMTEEKSLVDALVAKTLALRKRYGSDVCRSLVSVYRVAEPLIKAGGLKPDRKSVLARPIYRKGLIETTSLVALQKTIGTWGHPTGLGYLLTHSDRPSVDVIDNRNPFAFLTKHIGRLKVHVDEKGNLLKMSFEMALAYKIAQSPGNLSPGDVFRMAVKVTDGDLPLAMLTAHNLFKEAAYAHRTGERMTLGMLKRVSSSAERKGYLNALRKLMGGYLTKDEFIADPDVIRGKLQDIRPVYDPEVEDRLGPWYHSFGLLFVGTNPALGPYSAIVAANFENLTRFVALGSSTSLGKEAANQCAAEISRRLQRLRAAAAR